MNFMKSSEHKGLLAMIEWSKGRKKKKDRPNKGWMKNEPPLGVDHLVQRFKLLKTLIETSYTLSIDYIQAASNGYDIKTINGMVSLGMLKVKEGCRGIFEIGEYSDEESLEWLKTGKRVDKGYAQRGYRGGKDPK